MGIATPIFSTTNISSLHIKPTTRHNKDLRLHDQHCVNSGLILLQLPAKTVSKYNSLKFCQQLK